MQRKQCITKPPDDLLRTGYPLLVRGLANLCVMVSDTPDGLAVRFVTLEQGSNGVGPVHRPVSIAGGSLNGVTPLD